MAIIHGDNAEIMYRVECGDYARGQCRDYVRGGVRRLSTETMQKLCTRGNVEIM